MQLRRAMLQSFLQQLAVIALSFGTGVVIARLMTPREVGPYAIAMAAVNATAALKDFGVGSYVISHGEDDEGLVRAAYGLTLAIAAALALVLVALSEPLAAFYQEPVVGHVLRIVACAQILPAIGFPATVSLNRSMRFDALLVVGVAAAASQCGASIALACLDFGTAALAWGFVAMGATTALTTWMLCPSHFWLLPTFKGCYRLLAFGSWMSAAMLTGSTAASMPELMVGRVLGVADAAIFSRSQNIVAIIRNGLFMATMKPMLPKLGMCEREGKSLAPLYLRVIASVTGLAWPAYALLVIWAEPLIRLLYGPAWGAAGAMILPLALAQGLTLAVAPHYDVMIVKRRARLLFLCELAAFLFTAGAMALLVSSGLVEAVWALTLGGAFFASLYFVILKREVGFSAAGLISVWARSLALTLAVIPVTWLLRQYAGPSGVEVLGGFALSCVFATLTWLLAAWLVRHELLEPLGTLLRSVTQMPPYRFAKQPTPP